MEENEARRKKWETIFKWGLGLGGAIAASQVIFLAIKGIIGLAIAGGLGLVIVQLAPVFSLKLANRKIKLLVDEVEANPIETMQNLFLEKSKELAQADQDITEFETEVRNFDDQVDMFRSAYPEDAKSYEELSCRMHESLKDMKSEQSSARKGLQKFEEKIKRAQAILKMALAAQKVVQLSKTSEAKVFAQIKEQVAFDTVRTELNRTFASLNTALERRADTRTLPAPVAETAKIIPMKEAVR
jgi:hypothetical protein